MSETVTAQHEARGMKSDLRVGNRGSVWKGLPCGASGGERRACLCRRVETAYRSERTRGRTSEKTSVVTYNKPCHDCAVSTQYSHGWRRSAVFKLPPFLLRLSRFTTLRKKTKNSSRDSTISSVYFQENYRPCNTSRLAVWYCVHNHFLKYGAC